VYNCFEGVKIDFKLKLQGVILVIDAT